MDPGDFLGATGCGALTCETYLGRLTDWVRGEADPGSTSGVLSGILG